MKNSMKNHNFSQISLNNEDHNASEVKFVHV